MPPENHQSLYRNIAPVEPMMPRTEKGQLRIAFPDKVVEYWLPGLFTDLPVDGE